MKKYFLLLIKLLLIVSNSNAQVNNSFSQEKNEQYYYNKVKVRMERAGGFHPLIKDDITKAIEFNPENAEYRWIRARANINSYSQEPDYIQAVGDLNKMIELGDKTGKVYGFLGICYKKLGDMYNYEKKAKKSESFSDDDSGFLNEQKGINETAILYYKKSIEAYRQAIEVNPEKFKENLKYEEPELLKSITEVEEKSKKLK